MTTHVIVTVVDLVVILMALWEVYKLIRDSHKGLYVENSPWHTNQHIGILIGFISYASSVLFLIYYMGYEFSDEWLPTNLLLNLVVVVAIWHFSLERDR